MSRSRGRPPKSDEGLVREKILEVATRLFSDRGFSATSVNQICEVAEVGKPAVYWHFKSKEGLLEAVLDRVNRQWIEDLQKQSPPTEGAADRLKSFTDNWRRTVLERPHHLRLPMLIEMERGEGEAGPRRTMVNLWRLAEEKLIEGIQESIPLPLAELDVLGQTAVTLLQGAMLRHVLDPDDDRLARVLDEFRRTVSLLVWARLDPAVRKDTVEHLVVLKELDARRQAQAASRSAASA